MGKKIIMSTQYTAFKELLEGTTPTSSSFSDDFNAPIPSFTECKQLGFTNYKIYRIVKGFVLTNNLLKKLSNNDETRVNVDLEVDVDRWTSLVNGSNLEGEEELFMSYYLPSFISAFKINPHGIIWSKQHRAKSRENDQTYWFFGLMLAFLLFQGEKSE
jgi:hypothetical protein